jgi:hypothetical protein
MWKCCVEVKMRKFMAFVFLILGVASIGYAQREMPEEVKKFLENYFEDTTIDHSFLRAQRAGFIREPVQIKDLRMITLEVYQLKHIFLDAYPDTVPFSEIIEPTGHWIALITANNKALYEVFLKNSEEGPRTIGMAPLTRGMPPEYMWEQLLKVNPESTGINPVFFSRYGHILGSRENILYFEQKGPRKIFYIRSRGDDVALRSRFTAPIETLDDSKKLIEYWKKQGLNEVGIHGHNRAKTGGGK